MATRPTAVTPPMSGEIIHAPSGYVACVVAVDNDEGMALSKKQSPPNDIDINPQLILQHAKAERSEMVYEIILHAMKISKIKNVDAFKKCNSLDLSSNAIVTIENLSVLKELKELKCYDNLITEIKNLDSLVDLTNLQLQHNHICTIGTGLNKLQKLRQLRLDNNKISELSVNQLTNCSALTALNLSYNKIVDITPLNCLPNLKDLCVSYNRLRQIADLGRCRKLSELAASGNKIVDLSGLKGLPHLSVLDVSQNLLVSLASMGCSQSLRELDLSENMFNKLGKLSSAFPDLEVLKLSNNKVEDWLEFEKLSACTNLAELHLDGNPAYDWQENHVTSNQQISAMMPRLDMFNGAQIYRKALSDAPMMRPMSVLSVRHVEHQMKSIENEMTAFEADFRKKFESMTSSMSILLSEPSADSEHRDTSRDVAALTLSRPSTSGKRRCSSRTKLLQAMHYASENFND